MSIYERVNQMRVQKGLSFYALEKESGLSRQTIEKWSTRNSKPSFDALVKLADYFQISLDELVGREGYVEARQPIKTEVQAIYDELDDDYRRQLLSFGKVLLRDMTAQKGNLAKTDKK